MSSNIFVSFCLLFPDSPITCVLNCLIQSNKPLRLYSLKKKKKKKLFSLLSSWIIPIDIFKFTYSFLCQIYLAITLIMQMLPLTRDFIVLCRFSLMIHYQKEPTVWRICFYEFYLQDSTRPHCKYQRKSPYCFSRGWWRENCILKYALSVRFSLTMPALEGHYFARF